jgi:hypothetical protein
MAKYATREETCSIDDIAKSVDQLQNDIDVAIANNERMLVASWARARGCQVPQ